MPATKSKLERKCEVCGNLFIAKTIYSKYCSKHCSDVASRQKKKQKKLEEQKQQIVSMIPDERPYISIPEAIRRCGIPKCQKGKYVYVPKNEIDKVFNAKN